MHWLKCTLLVATLCSAQGFDPVVTAEREDKDEEIATAVAPEKSSTDGRSSDSVALEPISIEKTDSTANLTEGLSTPPKNLSDTSNRTDLTALTDGQLDLKANQKRNAENVTFNDITPFLLFPILPFLFPPIEDKASLKGKPTLPPRSNDSSLEESSAKVKPFIFFDFAFNFRRVPLKNRTERSEDPKLTNEGAKENSQSSRRRRNTNTKVDTLGFFDDSPPFPDSELDEFLPKPDLFFPDLPFHHKPLRKLNRRKRDQNKLPTPPDLKTDLKMIMDVFDDAFMRTKKEVERTDPFLNILSEAERSFDDDRKEPDDPFAPASDSQEKPTMKWRIQRNIKRLNNDRPGDLPKSQETPMIIVDKVVKIGEFHMHDDTHDKNKLKKKKKKRDAKESKDRFLPDDNRDELAPSEEVEGIPKNLLEVLKQEGSKKKKRSHHQAHANVQSKEIRVLPQTNTSVFSVGSNATIEVKPKAAEGQVQKDGMASKAEKYANLLKVVDSLKGKVKAELEKVDAVGERRAEREAQGLNYEQTRKRTYDELRKNVTELIESFLAVVKEFDDTQLMERLDVSEREDSGMFDWTEKETLQNSDTYFLRKDSRAKRQKNADIEKEFVELGKERQVTDLNYLFLTVTLPTVFVFALVLLVCFFNLQIKGKLCTKLFRPRQIFLVEDEVPSQFVCKNAPGVKKIQSI